MRNQEPWKARDFVARFLSGLPSGNFTDKETSIPYVCNQRWDGRARIGRVLDRCVETTP
jgi:hypothetical protein